MALNFSKWLVRQKGGSLEAMIAPKPLVLQPTEVLIRVKAIAINPADYKMIDQGHRVTSWPLVPGLDGAGVIEQVGDKAGDFMDGDRVLALFTPGDSSGSYQEYAVVQGKDVAKIPATWSLEEAATLGFVVSLIFYMYLSKPWYQSILTLSFFTSVCYLTGIMALGIAFKTPLPFIEDGPTSGLQPSSVLILGGSSAVGAATIQLLRLAIPDCKILATSSTRHHDHLRNYLGVDEVIDRNSSSLPQDAKQATAGRQGVDAILDVVAAGRAQRDIFEALSPTGPKIYAQVWTGDEEIVAPEGVNSIMFRGRDLPQLPGNQNIVRALEQLLQEKRYKLPLPVHHVGHGLSALEKALGLMRQGVSGEKLVVSI
jgi:NADPH:quinone reductase-like Zn-dependent oxidoreductase